MTYELSKLELRIHYDSSFLTPNDSNNGDKFELKSPPEFINNNDFQNYDDNPDTDKFLLIKWAGSDNKLPEGNLPFKIGQLFFHTSTDKIDSLTGESNSTMINFTAESTGENYDFLSSSTILKPLTFNLDVDGNGKVTALGDGVMIIRKLFGAAFDGEKLTANIITDSTTRSTEEIHNYISSMTEISMII